MAMHVRALVLAFGVAEFGRRDEVMLKRTHFGLSMVRNKTHRMHARSISFYVMLSRVR